MGQLILPNESPGVVTVGQEKRQTIPAQSPIAIATVFRFRVGEIIPLKGVEFIVTEVAPDRIILSGRKFSANEMKRRRIAADQAAKAARQRR